MREAVAEITTAARSDATRGAEGAIAFLQRLSPALENIDSSTGALGNAVNRVIDELVAIIVAAPVDQQTRAVWLEKIWAAFMADRIPYLESLGDRWGDLCNDPHIASAWADRLLPELRASFAAARGASSYFHGSTACLSALFSAKRYDDLMQTIDRAPLRFWTYRSWGFRALVAQGRRAEALRYAEASRDRDDRHDVDIARACEEMLLASGMAETAYQRYAIAASVTESTYVARFRSLAKRYPWKAQSDLLTDLAASTPGNEGKWFAAAKTAGLFDEAIALANASPCDPKTLSRAARDSVMRQPEFAMHAALAALRWFSKGFGFDVTSVDIIDAHRYGAEAAMAIERIDEYCARVRSIANDGDALVRAALADVLTPPGA